MQARMRIVQRVFVCVGLLLMASPSAGAEEPGDPAEYLLEVGSPAFNMPERVPNGFVNPANGNLHIEIPIVSYPQRGGIPSVAKWVYDSRIWRISPFPYGNGWTSDNVPDSPYSGWRLKTTGANGSSSFTPPVAYDQVGKSCYSNNVPYYWSEYSNYRYLDMGGTKRRFAIYTEIPTSPLPCHTATNLNTSGPAIDGSGMLMKLLGNYPNVEAVLDAGGNKIFGSGYSSPYKWVTDLPP